MRTWKRPGENTLKKELWTKFEAASSYGLRSNVSALQRTAQKGFLDLLDEVSCDGESPVTDSVRWRTLVFSLMFEDFVLQILLYGIANTFLCYYVRTTASRAHVFCIVHKFTSKNCYLSLHFFPVYPFSSLLMALLFMSETSIAKSGINSSEVSEAINSFWNFNYIIVAG